MATIISETITITLSKLIKDDALNKPIIATERMIDLINEHTESLVDNTVIVEVHKEKTLDDIYEENRLAAQKAWNETDELPGYTKEPDIGTLRYDPETDQFLNTDPAPKA